MDTLRKNLARNGYKLQTGFVGTPLLCNVLSEHKMEDIAWRLLLNEEYPGWLYEVNLGATTIWERWNSVLADGHISPTEMNSLNHYSSGAIVEWMFRHCAGINPVEDYPGFRKVRFVPSLNWKLHHIEAICQTAAGLYKIGWEVLDERHVKIWVEIPFGCSAYLKLPFMSENQSDRENRIFTHMENGDCVLEAGYYSVNYETSVPLRKYFSTQNTTREIMDHSEAKEAAMKANPAMAQIPVEEYDRPLYELLSEYLGKDAGMALSVLDEYLGKVEF